MGRKKAGKFERFVIIFTSSETIIGFIIGTLVVQVILGLIYNDWLLGLARIFRILTNFLYLEIVFILIKRIRYKQ